ncbi:MAG: hypothetical protein IKU01_06745 [Bacteroidales bacterium]|nr:hypothetical protein [Bacteroidales bacterium]
MIMRNLIFALITILFGCQQTTVNGQQTSCTVTELVEGTTSGGATSSATSFPRTVDFHESQIRIADSLYKNYLPQYNFDEVKAAMEFFDSIRNDELAIRNYGRRKAIPNSTFLISNYQCAKAHYYHAVGLTEKDDIVGACEHYLIALEIMEEMMANDKSLKAKGKKSVDNPEDYEKIRFIYLIHTRLGEIFYDANYCDISIANNKKALNYSNNLNNTLSTARTYKYIGNSYQLLNNVDSALYYYNKSLKTSENTNNKLDVEKCIAQIMYYSKGAKDSAYVLLKSNLNKIDNENVRYSYHYTIGDMFYVDKKYDSALYYLEESLDDSIIIKNIAFTTTLSAIYDSLGNNEKRAYYDNISSKLLIRSINKEIDKSKLQAIYNDYNERNQKKVKAITKKRSIYLCNLIIIVVLSVFITIRYKHKKHSNKLSEEIMAKDKHIKQNEFKNALIEGKIKSKNAELKQKDEQIISQQLKIDELQSKLENRKDNLKEYYQSEICVKIVNEINELSKSNRMTSELKPLSQEEFVILLQSANVHLNVFFKSISNKYAYLKKEDLYYLCLMILNLNDKQIAALFGLSYDAIRKRKNKIIAMFEVNSKEDLYKNIMKLL